MNNIMETIASLKSIVETTQKQLNTMQNDDHPNRQLMVTVQENHDRALETLRMLSQIQSPAATSHQNNNSPKVSFPEEDAQHLTRAQYREMLKHNKQSRSK